MRSYRKWAATIAIVTASVVLAIGTARAQTAADLYKTKCQTCHGPGGAGTPLGKSLGVHDFHSPEVQKMTDAQLIEVITQGKGNMPAYGARNLTAEQIKELAGYVRELGNKKK